MKQKISYFIQKYKKHLILGVLIPMVIFSVLFLRIYRIDGKVAIELGNPQDSLVAIKTNEITKRHIPFLKDSNFAKKDTKIAWITDIHADRFKKRDVDSGLLFPRQYKDYLPKVFDELHSRGIDTVIATGDNTNSGDDNYARELQHIAQEKHMNVLWVRGNHDNDKVMSILNVNRNNTNDYYFFDIGNTRIITLNNVTGEESDSSSYLGSIGQAQLDWLREIIQTEKQVIVTLHIPIFNADLSQNHDLSGVDFTGEKTLLEEYAELEKIFRESGNVKLVLSGHWHIPWHKELSGINYYGEAALTRTGYSGAYAIIDLQSTSVEYLFAK